MSQLCRGWIYLINFHRECSAGALKLDLAQVDLQQALPLTQDGFKLLPQKQIKSKMGTHFFLIALF